MKNKILYLLRNSKEAISGQALCEKMGVSRTAIWKYINQLKDEGYVIEASQNKGYIISQYPDVITDTEIASQLISSIEDDGSYKLDGIVKRIVYFDETESTNKLAKEYAESGKDNGEDGILYITESQTNGRGRRGRQWVSPAGNGIYMSLVLRPQLDPTKASMLTIIAALSMTEAIRQVVGKIDCQIKWPNDIVVNGKKISGILTEMSAELESIHYVVIGIGINVNTTEFDDSIKDIASSIFRETDRKIKRSEIVVAFSKCFEKYYKDFLEDENLGRVVETYNSMCINVDRDVRIEGVKDTFTGVAKGIDSMGELIVEKEDGTTTKVIAGEVSVRGLYGYAL